MNEQTATIGSGSGNTIIQIVGSDNTIVPGYGWLKLTRHTRRAITSELQQLIPYNRSTTLIGRTPELEDLRRFAKSPEPISIRVLTGSGGTGKTRLALDFCDELAAQGWDSGFVGDGDAGGQAGELQRFAQSQNLSAWGWRKPTFIVVDYAAGHVSALATWVAALARRETADGAPPAPPLRLLLLERHGQRDGGWFAEVFGSGAFSDVAKQDLLNPREPVTVAPLTSAEHRARLMNEVLAANVPAGKATLRVDEALVNQYVSAASWGGAPLFLIIAALYAVEVGHTEALARPGTDLARALAKREAARLSTLANAHRPPVSPELVRHLAACVTLAGGMSRAQFIAFARAEKLAVGYDDNCDPATLANLLADALPAEQAGTLSPLLPDLIGEAFVINVCHDSGAADIERWRNALGWPALQSLLRCAQDFTVHHHDFPRPQLTDWCRSIRTQAEALDQFDQLIPKDSVALRALNLQVAEYRSDRSLSDASVDDYLNRAHQLSLLAIAQANMGAGEKAVAAVQEVVTLRRALAERRPGAFDSNLALSLNNLANRLSHMGEREKALAAVQEALTLYRALAAQQPDAFNPDLASSLNNLANFLSELGEREKALAAAQEAMTLYRALAAQQPDAFNPDLASSLNNLANFLSELGEREKALATAQEAVTLYRALAAQRPDAFHSNLALSLNNLANRLSDLGEREQAVAAAQEAVTLYRWALAAQRPDAFNPDLASSLNKLANFLSELGEREKALATAQEAVTLYRALAAQRPDAFHPNLASSLNNLANFLSELGEGEKALAAAQEAVTLSRAMVAL